MAQDKALHFLPWLRTGLGAVSETIDTDNARRKATVALKIVDKAGGPLNDQNGNPPQAHVATLKGPGDVLGFDPSLIARTEPKNGANDFEPNYFPFVEFIDSDFPWRYSPDGGADGKLRPWIVLLVLKKNEYQVVRSARGQSSKIRILAKEGIYPLPDLVTSWAWAHVQIAGPGPASRDALAAYLAENPGLHCSRLMCPRKLEPLTRYTSFVVPAYEVGRLAGLGLPPPPDTKAFAWSVPPVESPEAPVLPVYFQWEFQTSEEGDFEALIEKIEFIKGVPDGVGVRPIDGAHPGFLKESNGEDLRLDNDTFRLEGALVPPGYMKGESDDPKRELLTNSAFTSALLPVLNKSIEPSEPLNAEAPDPLVTVPVYGYHFQRTTEIVPPSSSGAWPMNNSWVHEMNLDRRYRVTASMGTSVVQQNQEQYTDECWAQVGEIREANQALRLAAASRLLNDNIKKRHIDPLTDSRFALISRPYQHYYLHNDGKDKRSFKYRFEQSGLQPAITSSAFRSVASKTIGLRQEKLFGPWEIAKKNDSFWKRVLRILLYVFKLLVAALRALANLADKYSQLLPTLTLIVRGTGGGQSAPRGLIIRLLAVVAIVLMKLGILLRGAVPFLEWLLFRVKVPAVNEISRVSRSDASLQKNLTSLSEDDSPLSSVAPLKSEIIEVKPIDIAGSFRPLFDTRVDLMERLKTTLVFCADGQLISFDPIMMAPHIDLSMYTHLSEQSVDLMVPGLKEMKNNTVIMMEENKKFIQSFMVGLNHEMGRELVWREYPTDQRGTIFRYFWDLRAAESPPADIADIHTWLKELGLNTPWEAPAAENRLVLAIKADLIRRYPNIIVFALRTKKDMTKAEWEGVLRSYDDPGCTEPHAEYTVFKPVLSANVSVDILFVGFEFSIDTVRTARANGEEYYFVLMQQPSLPRFGLDAGTTAPEITKWNELSWGHVVPDAISGWITDKLTDNDAVPDKPPWMKSSAAMGMITFQQPVRMARPSSDFTEEKS